MKQGARADARPTDSDLADAAAQIREWLAGSERVLIGAGAGLSVAAGVDYGDPASFARLFPAMVRRGFTARYQLIGRRLPPAVFWGYWAAHVHDVRFTERHAPVYARLRELVGDKDTFVLTSNVDALFPRHGFDAERLFTPQGDYAAMQCMTQRLPVCAQTTWPSAPIIERLRAATDPATLEVTDPDAIPRCPHCGGEPFLNVRLSHTFVETPYVEQARRFAAWVRAAAGAPLLVLEIGAGYNTPGVVRWPLEQLVERHPGARFARVNPEHPEVPGDIAARALSVPHGAAAVLDALAGAAG